MKKIFFMLILIILLASCNKGTSLETSNRDEESHVHSYGDWTVIENSTCIMEGSKQKVCFCGDVINEVIPLKNHQYPDFLTTFDAINHYRQCETCLEFDTDSHSFSEWVTIDFPTCTKNGVKTRTCFCGKTEEKPIYKSHNFPDNWASYDDEKHYKECIDCGKVEKATHLFGKWEVIAEANCTENGLKKLLCSCGKALEEDIIAFGHTYNEGNHMCVVCDFIKPTESLELELREDSYYAVIGLGSTSDETIVIPSVYKNLPVKEISSEAFKNASSITKVIISDNIIYIGSNAFYGCESLVDITIGTDISSIGEKAFYLCDSLCNIYYNGTIEDWCKIDFADSASTPMNIGKNFYMDNILIDTIVIPKDISIIKPYSFYGFESIISVSVPYTITKFGKYAFYDCTSLENVYYNGNIEKWCNIVFEDYRSSPMYCANNFYIDEVKITEIRIPNNIIEIKDFAFSNFKNLKKIDIGNDVNRVGNYAFYNCKSITELVIGNNVTSIGDYAFYDCISLVKVIIGNNLEKVGEKSFTRCHKLFEIYNLSTISITQKSPENGYIGYYSKVIHTSLNEKSILEFANDYIFLKLNDIYYLLGYAGDEATIILPDLYNECEYYISEYAFYRNNNIKNVTISKSIKYIGSYAFYLCENLSSVKFEDHSGWETGYSSFYTDNLSNSSVAATYLTTTYYNARWTKTE